MPVLAASITETLWTALGGDAAALTRLGFVGEGGLASTFPVTEVASASIAAAALAVGEVQQTRGNPAPLITIDRRLASMWFAGSLRPLEWTLPPPWDPMSGDYRAKDGWIRVHANAPHHRAAAQRVLGCSGDQASVARCIADRGKTELEAAIIEAGGCAAEMRSVAAWLAHPQGLAVCAEPLAHLQASDDRGPRPVHASASRPLAGIRVLDLTRVLAGPIATRFLAGYGAEVLRIDPPEWMEPAVAPEVTLGKRCARLDLKSREGRACLESLLAAAHVVIHGYRPEALDRLGLDADRRRAMSPGLIDVSLDAYGWTGPWAGRRGFDSLVQMSAGIAEAGMQWKHSERPCPLPVQALDHATGYLAAAAALRGIARRHLTGGGWQARLSLARTAKVLIDLGAGHTQSAIAGEAAEDVVPTIEATTWGNARRLHPPVIIENAPMRWSLPACQLGSAAPQWNDAA
jgi:CoA-transferase family III